MAKAEEAEEKSQVSGWRGFQERGRALPRTAWLPRSQYPTFCKDSQDHLLSACLQTIYRWPSSPNSLHVKHQHLLGFSRSSPKHLTVTCEAKPLVTTLALPGKAAASYLSLFFPPALYFLGNAPAVFPWTKSRNATKPKENNMIIMAFLELAQSRPMSARQSLFL